MSDLSPDDLSSDASALLDAARGGFDPPAEAKSRMRRGLATAVGVATGAVTSGAAATSAAAAAATGSAATATGLVAGGSATASVVTAAGTSATTAVVGTGIGATLTAKVVVGLAVAASVAFGTVVVTSNVDAPAASVPSASAQPSVAPSAAPLAMLPKPVAEAASVSTVAPPASVAPLAVAPEPPPLVRPTAPPSIVPTANVTAATVAATSAPAPARSDLAREADMLRAALAAPPAQALALLDDHARQFPRGTLAEERDAQRVVTLCQLGRRSDAAASYTRFLSAFPASIHRARLDRTCAVTP